MIQEAVNGELTYKAFDQFAQLVLGEVEDIGPVGDVTTQEDSASRYIVPGRAAMRLSESFTLVDCLS